MQYKASRLWPNFKCAEGASYEPVSPFVYIHTDAELAKPVQVHIPHYIDSDDKENIVLLVKGQQEDSVFEVLEDSKYTINEATVCIEMRHFCVLCLAAARDGRPKRRRYQVLTAEKTIGNIKELQICILYSMACLKVWITEFHC